MADNFDLKKFLKESKALENLNPSLKAVNENEYYKDAEKDDAAHIRDLEDDMKDDKKASMKAKIKEMIVAELELDIDDSDKTDAELNADYDPVYEGENGPAYKGPEGYDDSCDCYPEDDLEEAKKKDKEGDVEDVEVTDTDVEDVSLEDVPADEAPADVTGGLEDISADMKGTEADLMDHLMKAFQIAKGMNNEKLETQVGNTLKFFVSEYIGGGEQ
jgi:hypothetical protein